jgi:hypothetical protein
MKKLIAIGLVISMVLSIIVVGVSLAEELAVGAGAAKEPLWDSRGHTVEGGATMTNDAYGFVILNTDESGELIVQFALKGATANAVFRLYVNQIVNSVIQRPNEVGSLKTNGQGNGNAHFNLSREVGADKFWVTAHDPYPCTLVLRSKAVVLD